MGCLAFKQEGSREGVQLSTEGSDKVNRTKDLKISSSLLIKESQGDPYLLYDTLKPLGEGAFGKVLKVRHKKTGCTFALKEINKHVDLGDDEEKTFVKEINILMKLDHPNILKVYEYYNTKRKYFIITELCTGGELFDQITKVKRFDEHVSAHIFRQILSAVNFCHINNIIHRDLKPENILIENESEKSKDYFTVKVIDFGTSEIFKKNAILNKRIGTPFYIAPEVLNNAYNEKCDLWSCGVILYILLSGVPPFYGRTDEEIYKKVGIGKFSMEGNVWGEVSNEAKDLIKCLLIRDVVKRFSAEEALNHPWFKKMREKREYKPLSQETLQMISQNLSSFHASQKLQQAALAFIVHNLIKKEDCEEMRKAFIEFDENGDGHLTKDELRKGLMKVMTPTEAENEANRVMELADTDNNGYIEYEEFLRATLNKDSLLSDQNLQSAFSLFDKNGTGKISAAEVKLAFVGTDDIGDNVFDELIKEINESGEISFRDFKDIMNKMMVKK